MWRNILKTLSVTAGVATLANIGWNLAPQSRSYVPYEVFMNATNSIANATVTNNTFSHAEPSPPVQPALTMDDVYRMMITFIPLLSRLAAQASIEAIKSTGAVSSEWWFQRYPQYTAYLVALIIGRTYLDSLSTAVVQAFEYVYADRVGLQKYFETWAATEMAKNSQEHELKMAEHEARSKLNEERFDAVEKRIVMQQMKIVDALLAEGRPLEAAKLLGMPVKPAPLPEIEAAEAEDLPGTILAEEEQQPCQGEQEEIRAIEAIEATSVPELTEGPPEGMRPIEEQQHEEEAKQAEGPPEGTTAIEEQQQPQQHEEHEPSVPPVIEATATDGSTGGPPAQIKTAEEPNNEEVDEYDIAILKDLLENPGVSETPGDRQASSSPLLSTHSSDFADVNLAQRGEGDVGEGNEGDWEDEAEEEEAAAQEVEQAEAQGPGERKDDDDDAAKKKQEEVVTKQWGTGKDIDDEIEPPQIFSGTGRRILPVRRFKGKRINPYAPSSAGSEQQSDLPEETEDERIAAPARELKEMDERDANGGEGSSGA